MKDKLIKLLRRAEKDKPYPDELAEEIMELIDAQRCEWTNKGHYAETGCGRRVSIRWFNIDIQSAAFPFCPCCGKRIEVKDGQG